MSEKEITEEEIEKEVYEREDSESGYTTKASETALLKASRKYDVISNRLLGNYDENGHYYIPTEILTELASLKKIVGVTNEFGTELKAPYKDGITFNFILKIGKKDPETQKAESVLYLMEVVNKVNGYIQNILTTPVATYSYKFDEHYKEYCYRALHIVANIDESDDGALNGDAVNINKRFEYLDAVQNASKDQYLVLEESFFNARIQILNDIPQGAIVLSEFNKRRAALEKFFINNPKNKFRALNELLTSILEAYFDELEDMPAYKIAIQILILKYLNQVMKISEHIKGTKEYQKAKETPTLVAGGAPAPAQSEQKPKKGVVKIASGGAPKKKAEPKIKLYSAKSSSSKPSSSKPKGKDKKGYVPGKTKPATPKPIAPSAPAPKTPIAQKAKKGNHRFTPTPTPTGIIR